MLVTATAKAAYHTIKPKIPNSNNMPITREIMLYFLAAADALWARCISPAAYAEST